MEGVDKVEIKDVLYSGEWYNPEQPEFLEEQKKYQALLHQVNQLCPLESEEQERLLKELLAHFGEGSYIQLPMHANWGCNTYVGDRVYANFNLTLVDDGPITIEDDVMIGPNVTLATAKHPLCASKRREKLQANEAIVIKENVWIGSNVSVMPGVTIGANAVIGAGSVVTKDIPNNVLAYGVPCKVIKDLNEEDREEYASPYL